MKTFYFTENRKQRKYGIEVFGDIFKISKNKLNYVTSYDFNTASCRGLDSEVLNAIVNVKMLPKKYYGYIFDVIEKVQVINLNDLK